MIALSTGALAVVPDPLSDKYTGSAEITSLAKLYVLIEKLQDIGAKNLILEAMLLSAQAIRSDGSSYALGSNEVRIVYEGTLPGSPMRRLIVYMYTRWACKEWLVDFSGEGQWLGEFM
ncbi:hypothetical protein EJ02DRAFT_450471 [Clathrospora elynae]|uniref:Uncharacterized protein n=1 Tax=Clathrospora elynae TaxID=706981 RepID=A0A6A5T2A1_9PLEO|nr:hypothetical protein EJ02DRAFT_450471 [Clathrospora elynae]